MSSEPTDRLPSSKKQGKVETVAVVRGRYESSDLVWKTRTVGVFKRIVYADTDLLVRVVLGHADLTFEVYDREGRQRLDDGTHRNISVQWYAPKSPSVAVRQCS